VARLAIQLKFMEKIQGVTEYNPTDTIVDVAQQLPPNSHMVMLYSPIDFQKGLTWWSGPLLRMACMSQPLFLFKF
jgi:hypothetical protein